jgi:hypothetical protein
MSSTRSSSSCSVGVSSIRTLETREDVSATEFVYWYHFKNLMLWVNTNVIISSEVLFVNEAHIEVAIIFISSSQYVPERSIKCKYLEAFRIFQDCK